MLAQDKRVRRLSTQVVAPTTSDALRPPAGSSDSPSERERPASTGGGGGAGRPCEGGGQPRLFLRVSLYFAGQERVTSGWEEKAGRGNNAGRSNNEERRTK